jgi:phenylalanyl-tRNA synthetase beta chain
VRAKNHKQGDKVVVALPGAVLPGNFEIKISKIRDVESRGMLCSEKELGLSSESEGIKILPENAKVGQAFADYQGLNDILFEVNVTPNRADCLSHIGIARELSCLLGRKLKLPKVKIDKTKHSTKKMMKVELKDQALCPRYAGRVVRNVKVGPSPLWLKQRLESLGLNSINNVVDITNYVMLEYGQPLHAFDLNELKGSKVVIARSKGEKFKSLDGTEHDLTTEDLTIRDGERAVALAGVVGGLNSGIQDSSCDLFVESAHFLQSTVRRTSRRLGIETDSAYRFSRGTDPEAVVEALNRACGLLQELAGGEVALDHVDLYPNKYKKKPIRVRQEILEQRLGYPVKLNEFAQWMKRLHCEARVNQKVCVVSAPAFRWDLEMEMDLVEEFARLNGYDKIPEKFPPLCSAPSTDAVAYTTKKNLTHLMTEVGYLQAVNYHFTAPKWQGLIYDAKAWSACGLQVEGEAVAVKNPLSEETSVMRQSLLPGLLQNMIFNSHHSQSYGRLFEVGQVFGQKAPGEFVEPTRLSMVGWGVRSSIWQKAADPIVLELKAAIERILSRLQATGYQWKDLPQESLPSLLHPGQSAALFYQGKLCGFVGTLHPKFRSEQKIREEAAVAELNVELLMQGQPRLPKLKALSKYPTVERDLAFLVPDAVKSADLVREIQKAGGSELQWVKVFDLYQGEGLPEGHKSLAFRLRFQKADGTFSEDEILARVKASAEALEKKFAVKLR